MLDKKQVASTEAEVLRLFGHLPDIHVRVRGGRALYEVQVFTPRCNNVGRGQSLKDALSHLKEVNGHGQT